MKTADHSIHVAIIGAGIAGLACANALSRVNHKVTVFEAEADSQTSTGGLRLAPNATKILYHWGLAEQIKRVSFKSQAVTLNLYESGDLLGHHVWNEEIIKETRGEYRCIGYNSLQKVLADAALAAGASIRPKCRVVDIDAEGKTLTLESGEVFFADMIIGADGLAGVTSHLVVQERETQDPLGLSVYNAYVPKATMLQHEDLAALFNDARGSVTTWFGDSISAIGFRYGGPESSEGYTIQLFAPGDSQGTWQDAPKPESLDRMIASMANANPSLQKLMRLSTTPHHVPASGSSLLDETEWVHDSGNVAVIGDAAHPLPVLVHPASMAIEDGAVLARLFLHLKNQEQIPSFLYAFQELRQARVKSIRDQEAGNLTFMMLPAGEMASYRDADLRAKQAAGRNVLDPVSDAGDDDVSASLWQEIKEQFGYDAEDEADNWWVNWGLLRERAKGNDHFSHNLQVQVAMVEAC